MQSLGSHTVGAQNTLSLFNIVLLFLDYEGDTKKSDDVLDFMFRWNSFNNLKLHLKVFSRKKYEETKVTFKSIADLRKGMGKTLPKTLSTLHLIKSYIESNNSGKKQVRYLFLTLDIFFAEESAF